MKRRRWLTVNVWRNIEGSIFILPWILGFLIFLAFPIGYSLYMSFHIVRISGSGIVTIPAGWEFYKLILFQQGSVLYNDLIPFLSQTLIMIPVIMIFSLMIAILLNQKIQGRIMFRTIFFLPVIFTTGQVVLEFIAQGEGGLDFLQNYSVTSLLIGNLPAGVSDAIVLVLERFILVLWYSGVQILIFLAGRQTISGSIYEAATIDGANPWDTFWKITLPGMVPFIFLNIVYTVVDLFTFPTNPIITKVNMSNYGLSSALAWIYFSIILAILGILLLVFARVVRTNRMVHQL